MRAGFVWGARVIVVLVLIAVVLFAVLFRKPLYHRFVLFPRQQQAWEEIRAQRVEPELKYALNEYRGIMHNHTELSHDCMVSHEKILEVLKQCDLDFIFKTDHYADGKADYSLGWKGLHGGKLFVRGYEMDQGFMPWGMPDDTVFRSGEDPYEVANKIGQAGGILFYAHCEEDRIWNLKQLTGMEIYNIHSDVKDEDYKAMLPDILLSINKYPDQAFRIIFDRPTPFLERLDALNRTRKIVGIAANDAHQNQGLRFIYTPNDTLLIKETGGETEKFNLKEFKLNFFSRLALRMLPGPLEPGTELYRIQLDKYETAARYVNTHILAENLTEKDLVNSLRAGRVFVGFDAIADARGFVWLAEGPQGKAGMGDTMPFGPEVRLKAAAPNKCRFTVIRDGQPLGAKQTGYNLVFTPPGPGKYRVECELNILDDWTPWIYSNYLELS